MTTRTEARDEMLSRIKAAWDSQTPAILGYVPMIIWQKKEEKTKPDKEKAYMRVNVAHNEGSQATFGEQRLFDREGIITCQIFTPLFKRQGLETDDQLAAVILQVLEGNWQGSGLIIRRSRAREIGETDDWYQTNVLGEFEYSELR